MAETAKKGSWGKRIVFIALAIVVIGALVFLKKPVSAALNGALEWVDGLGPAGIAAFIVIYAIAALLFPASVLTLGAGAVFGPIVGTAAVSVASTACACLAFVIGRTVGRDWIKKKMEAYPSFAAVDAAVGKQGFKIVLLTRLSPAFPFTWMNYAYGVTQVKFTTYALASWIGMLPGTFMYVYFGYIGRQAGTAGGESGGGGAKKWAINIGIALSAILITAYVTKLARKELKNATPGGETGAGTPKPA